VPAVTRASAALEKAGIPTVSIIGSTFVPLAILTGETKGVRGLPVVSYPGVFNVETEESFRENFKNIVLDDIIVKLTKPIKKKGAQLLRTGQKQFVFTGSFEQVNETFFNNQWTDGLPIVPPTPERVEAFLKYTDDSPNLEIAVLPPANLRATPWNIAVNGVMAGCKPEHMPVLLAIVKAIGDKEFNLEHLGTTWGDIPFVVMNGPIVKRLGFRHGQGTISLGPNPAIGRFLGSIIRNVAGFIPGETYMGTWGYPLPFVIAENEEESPWEPYHVEKGFDRKTSTVTVGGTFNWGPQKSFNDVKSVESALVWLCDYVGKVIQTPKTWMMASTDMYALLLTPPVARKLAEGGFSKQGLIKYIWENTTINVGELHTRFLDGAIGKPGTIRWYLEWGRVEEAKIREFEALEARGPETVLPQIISPREIHIFVTGDPGRDKVQCFWCWYNHPVTQEIKLPSNWDKLTGNLNDHRSSEKLE
jgi:hypothetical protein